MKHITEEKRETRKLEEIAVKRMGKSENQNMSIRQYILRDDESSQVTGRYTPAPARKLICFENGTEITVRYCDEVIACPNIVVVQNNAITVYDRNGNDLFVAEKSPDMLKRIFIIEDDTFFYDKGLLYRFGDKAGNLSITIYSEKNAEFDDATGSSNDVLFTFGILEKNFICFNGEMWEYDKISENWKDGFPIFYEFNNKSYVITNTGKSLLLTNS